MYVPPAFAEADRSRLHDFIERHSFGLLTSAIDGAPFATHLPFLLDRRHGPHGALVGHMARANPHWAGLDGAPALAVFAGPHAYVSPSWYEAENVVPTWNYTAVHALGTVRVIHDPAALLAIVRDSVATFEAGRPRPWVMTGGGPFVDRLLAQIVGFRLEIEVIEGKFKLSQNHPVDRRRKVARALRAQGGEGPGGVAELMERGLDPEPG